MSFYIFSLLGNETGHEPVGDGGSYPDLREHIVGVFVARLQHDVDIVEEGDEAVDDKDHPEVALGVGLPFLTRVEKGEHEDEDDGERGASQMEGVISQRRRKEDVAQQNRYSHAHRRPVVELLRGDAQVEEVHPHHHQTGDVEQIKNKLWPGVAQAEVEYAIEHDAHRQNGSHGGNADVEHFCILAES